MPLQLSDVIRSQRGLELRTGVVTATAGKSLTVNVDGGSLAAIATDQYTPAVGHVVIVIRTAARTWYALGSLGSSATAPSPPPAAPTTGTLTFPPTGNDAFANGNRVAQRYDVPQGTDSSGTTYSGAWYYGASPMATLAGLTVTAAAIWIERTTLGAAAASDLYAFTHAETDPGLNEPTPISGPASIGTLGKLQSGWLTLPTAWGQAIANGTAAGIGLGQDGAAAFLSANGVIAAPQCGAIRIDWSVS